MSTEAKTQIINTALSHLGETAIADITADPPSPKLAKVLGQMDGPAGAEAWVLARHPWLDALTYETLEPSAGLAGNWRWPHAFELPATFVKLWECDGSEYQTGSVKDDAGAMHKVIFSTATALNVSYTELKGADAYGPDLANAIGFELAARCAGPLQEKPDKADSLHRQALEAIAAAETGEANQHRTATPLFTSTLADARRLGA